METPFDYLARNQADWTKAAVDHFAPGHKRWGGPVQWGIWDVPETEIHVLPDVDGRDVLELGCGTGYISSWLARRGARAVGLDPTWAQLASARTFQKEFGVDFGIVAAAAEASPFKDESFDVVISEYGASIWSDPYRWIPEASRLLRPGGELIFLVNGTLLMVCMDEDEEVPATARMQRAYFGMHRFEWPGEEGVEFHLQFGAMIRLLRENGFDVDDLIEIRPSEGSTTSYKFVDLEWARRWPSEEVWKARKTGRRPASELSGQG
jgi:SAM-dependent methyltransferase